MTTSLKERLGLGAQAEAPAGEPEKLRSLTPVEREWKQRIYDRLLKVLDLSLLTTVEEGIARTQIREITSRLFLEESAPLSLPQRQFLGRRIEDEVMGHGPLEPLLADPTVADILGNGPHSVYVERRGKLELTEVRFNDDAHLMNIIDRIVSAVGRRVDESSPMVDARLADGSRVNAIIPPLSVDGPCLSIRRFGHEPLTAEDLVANNSLTKTMLDLLIGCVKARLNILISGGTGAGKTTLLNVLSAAISNRERIISIEDAAELQLHQDHVVRLETRPPNIEGKGAVHQRQLVINALRMRPDRIIVGEVRGEEALDMLQAMNTGHDGSLTTIHANTPRDAIGRLETMVAMASLNIPDSAIRRQITSAMDVVIQVNRMSDGTRKVTSIAEITGMEGNVVTMQDIFVFRKRGIKETGEVIGDFAATGIRPKFTERLVVAGVQVPISMFEATPIG